MKPSKRSVLPAIVSLVVSVVVSLALGGCATSALDMAPKSPDQPWAPATGAHGEIVPGAPAVAPPAGARDYTLPANTALANVPVPPEIDPEHEYSLAELIDIAQSNNPLTRTAWNDAREAALAAGIVRSSYLPYLAASAVGAHQNVHNNTSSTGPNVNVTSAEGVVAALSVQWLLFDFGERTAILNAAKQGSVIANIGFTAAHQHVIHAVSLAYYAEGAARARVSTAARTLKNTQEVQVAAEERFAHGIGTTVEVAQARQATAQARLLQVQADGAAEDAYQALIAAIGISPLTQIKIAQIADRKLPAPATDSIDRIVSDALGRRPDVLAAYAAQLASEEKVRAARAEFLPKVFASGTAAYNSGNTNLTALPALGNVPATVNITGNRWNFTVFAGITVPLYDGGMRAAVLEQARAKADNAATMLTHTREEAVHQIVVAQNGLRTALSAHEASTSLALAAQTTFDAALTAYRNGVGSITDATVSEIQLLQADNAETDSYSAALSAAATLALAVGALGSAPQ